eukprot:scaffold397407_cov24-Prasinocladus_malaysianus.AAC.1
MSDGRRALLCLLVVSHRPEQIDHTYDADRRPTSTRASLDDGLCHAPLCLSADPDQTFQRARMHKQNFAEKTPKRVKPQHAKLHNGRASLVYSTF